MQKQSWLSNASLHLPSGPPETFEEEVECGSAINPSLDDADTIYNPVILVGNIYELSSTFRRHLVADSETFRIETKVSEQV